MTIRQTRGSSAREHASLTANGHPPGDLTPVIPRTATKSRTRPRKQDDRTIQNSSKRIAKSMKDSGAALRLENEGEHIPAQAGSKRKRPVESAPKLEGDEEELPHNLGKVPKPSMVSKRESGDVEPQAMLHKSLKQEGDMESPKRLESPGAATTKGRKGKTDLPRTKPSPKTANEDPTANAPSLEKKAKTPSKKETYGLAEGISPFPDYPRPTPEECYKIADLLRKAHPEQKSRPKTIPEPSQIVAGCGEVPSILDALIRTLLSAATTGRNSSSAYQGMVARYGSRTKGVGKGSVDYNAVRLASQADLQEAIASGGLAKNKSKNIKAILDMVYAENQERRHALIAAKAEKDASAQPHGAEHETEKQKAAEIALAEDDVLSLDHYYALPTYDAIFTFVKYPGIGVKTAACTAMFCMQRDCFAVDTHVFRLCQWLGWVPPDNKKVGRDTTFSHCEVRIPDELKYDLHQLFIKHGKTCPRCRAATGETSASWSKGCPIEEYVNRTGPRKEGGSPAKKSPLQAASTSAKTRKAASKNAETESEESSEAEMSDLVDDDQAEDISSGIEAEEQPESPLRSARRVKGTSKSVKATTRSKVAPSRRSSNRQR